ncbi:DUF4338 domain-containing protein [Candidatus Bathyarchaeota archaeon]|nr:DUF4338 domain-containing protein [Candidatus Bathyarchaeota archaeon]
MSLPITACGRLFTAEDLEVIRSIILRDDTNRAQISREVCLRFGWLKPDGGLKEMSCRVALLRLHRLALIELPPPRHRNGNGVNHIEFTAASHPGNPITEGLSTIGPIELVRVIQRKQSRFWNELIQRHHYLGYTPLPGAQIRYLIYNKTGILLGAISFSASAWAVRPRDHFIGWTKEQRISHLHLVVNNSRFLILPWIHVKNLASKVLSQCAKQLPKDWHSCYGYTPVLLETFVEKERFAGTCYKAANWCHVGQTQGRGKLDRKKECNLPVKDIYLYPLSKNFREILTRLD